MSNTKITAKRKPRKKPSQGLGDTVEKLTTATGIKKLVEWVAGEDCGCEERKQKLNKLFPYRTTQCMTEQEYYYWGNFREKAEQTLTKEEADEIAIIWNRLFQARKFYRPCTCDPRAWQKMINEINQVYDAYEKAH